jgi:tetratricopeptide (TPR) repeat protein
MAFLKSLFSRSSTEADFTEAKAAREAFLANAQPDEESDAFNAASGLMLDRKDAECIAAYEALGQRYPERLGDTLSQIGAAQFFLGQLDEAIESYVAARTHGADESMMDDNIWEACEALIRKGQTAAAQRYLELCPTGSFVKQAKKALG